MNMTDNPPDPDQSSSAPAARSKDDPSEARQFNTRVGLMLFCIYLVLYVGFVLINAFAASVMESTVIAGLNLAIVYGFGLIIAAVVMAFVYGMVCKSEPVEPGKASKNATRDQQ